MESQPGVFRLQPMNLTELVGTVFKLYRQHLWLFVVVVAVVQVPYQIVSTLLQLGVRRTPQLLSQLHGQRLTSSQLQTLAHSALHNVGAELVVLLLLVVIALLLELAAFTKVVADCHEGRRTSAGLAYRVALDRPRTGAYPAGLLRRLDGRGGRAPGSSRAPDGPPRVATSDGFYH